MKTFRQFFVLLIGCSSVLLSRADESSIKFSDPSRPGHLAVNIAHGELTIVGADVDEIRVRTDAPENPKKKPRSDGMRVIGSSSSYMLEENDNHVVLEYGTDSWGQNAEFDIVVPHDTNLEISVRFGGEIRIENISGDVAINGLNGEVELVDLSGGALIESMNGEIEASFTAVHPDRPLSFSSMNGEIEVHLPEDAAANVRFRSQNGTIMTNFDEDVLVTTTSSGRAFAPAPHEEIVEFAAEMAEEAVEMAMEIAEEVREAVVEARRDRDRAKQEANRARSEAQRAQQEAHAAVDEAHAHANGEVWDNPPRAPRAPKAPRSPSIPSMAGGKVISGTLNGGGVDLQIATMNGDIVVRKRKD